MESCPYFYREYFSSWTWAAEKKSELELESSKTKKTLEKIFF